MTRAARTPLEPFTSARAVWDFVASLDMWVMRLGLDRIETVLKAMGQPQDQVQTIHLVGTNGKGSTSAMLESVYRAAGFKTGLFTSPHLMHVQERIQISGHPVAEVALVQAANRVAQAMGQVLEAPLTYFEFLTALAFGCFEAAEVDIALIEAGLGGRLDSTNVMARPLATVVTSISLDHQDRLGQTLAEITREKAAVFRPGVPVISVSQCPEVSSVIEAVSALRHAPWVVAESALVRLGAWVMTDHGAALRQINYGDETYLLGLLGRYQQHNLAGVLTVVDVLASVLPVPAPALAQGLHSVVWPGRFQWVAGQNLIIDGAHNEAGIAALLETLALDLPETPIDWGLALLVNRDPAVLRPLLAYTQTRSITWLEADNPASFHPPEGLMTALSPHGPQGCPQSVMPLPAYLQVRPYAEGLRIVTGSLYQAGAALRVLQPEPIA